MKCGEQLKTLEQIRLYGTSCRRYIQLRSTRIHLLTACHQIKNHALAYHSFAWLHPPQHPSTYFMMSSVWCTMA